MTDAVRAEALEPCPFCGGDARTDGSDEVGFFVSCNTCYCCVGEGYDRAAYPEHMFRDRDDAVAAWNRRSLTSQARLLEEAREVLEISMLHNETFHSLMPKGEGRQILWKRIQQARRVLSSLSQGEGDLDSRSLRADNGASPKA